MAYDNRVKVRSLGVASGTLRRRGAVSSEVAVEMARGARKLFGTRVAVAVTGVAGPGGGTAAKPVGLVFAAVSGGRRAVWKTGNFPGGRETVRRKAATMALKLLLSFVGDGGG